jgi:hypothetical protein
MFKMYKVDNSAGIKFNDQMVLIAGRHPEKVTQELVSVMNKIWEALPNVSPYVIKDFVNQEFDFTKAYNG